MNIKSKITRRNGQICDAEYIEGINPTQNLNGVILHGTHAYSFYKDKLVIVYGGEKKGWGLTGGAIEKNETWEDATTREIKEEANMKVLHLELIGYQDVDQISEVVRQTRVYCEVEPYGDFVSDPDGDISEIRLIDPSDINKYFNWGEIGDRAIERALELKKEYDARTRLGQGI